MSKEIRSIVDTSHARAEGNTAYLYGSEFSTCERIEAVTYSPGFSTVEAGLLQ